ncbi:sigma factor-like helix-turn-helix DNA-binding protein [Streptomyces sp. NPDC058637]|uniref:sigma factor-like helix-turn-helix DNA-binding protein n=1 Tax=Streptomyces sp. NPDC058637 TaxID=3346569 RepID=UPI00365622AA
MTRSATGPPSAAPLPSPKERRRLREARALSEEQVAAAVGVTPATVRAWETGRTSPRGRRRTAYARLIGSATSRTAVPDAATPSVEATGSTTMSPTEPGTGATPGAGTTTPVPAEPVPAGTTSVPAEPVPAGTTSVPVEPVSVPVGPVPVPAGSGSASSPAGPGGTAPAAPAAPAPGGPTAEEAFDALYARTAPGLVGQTYLLTGRPQLSREAVDHAFQLAWHRWPEVARDRDPAGWVRAAAYEYAMSPWHRLRRTHRRADPRPDDPGRGALLDALLDLPPSYRRTLLLYDGVGLDLPETAAETEASTPAAASRLMNARAALAERIPELAGPASPGEQSALIHERLGSLALAGTEQVPAPPPAGAVRRGSERKAELWTRAAICFCVMLIGTTAFTLKTAPTQYEQPLAPAERVGGVPPRGGPQKLTTQDLKLQKALRGEFAHGPERLVPRIP